MPFNRAAWEGTAPLTDVGRTMITDLGLVEVGWSAWSCDRVDANEEALGGIVTAILHRELHDPETGEITAVRYFRVLNPYLPPDHHHFAQTLVGSEIRLPEGVEQPNRQLIGRLIMKLCQRVGKPHSFITRSDLDALTDAWHLAAVVS